MCVKTRYHVNRFRQVAPGRTTVTFSYFVQILDKFLEFSDEIVCLSVVSVRFYTTYFKKVIINTLLSFVVSPANVVVL